MIRNYLRWNRPEGHYKDRDGLFIAVVPTKVIAAELETHGPHAPGPRKNASRRSLAIIPAV